MDEITTHHPLVTFALFAFNQEEYIREAIEGAFSQTYEPLEIILSDDCSTDGTFEIMQKMAGSYSGPHTVVVRQNQRNLGISDHTNVVFSASNGLYIALAAGDDISEPSRVEKLIEAVMAAIVSDTTSSPVSVLSAAEVINEAGLRVGVSSVPPTREWCAETASGLRFKSYGLSDLLCGWTRTHGATRMLHRKAFEEFGNIGKDCYDEDLIYALRSMLLGSTLYVDTLGIKYRRHSRNLSNADAMPLGDFSAVEKQMRDDVTRAFQKDCISIDDVRIALRWIDGRAAMRDLHKARLGLHKFEYAGVRKIFLAPDISRRTKLHIVPGSIIQAVKSIFIKTI